MIASIPSAAAVSSAAQAMTASLAGHSAQAGAAIAGGASAGSFAGELAEAVGRVEESAKASDALRDKLLRGENVELHTVAIQAQDAQISFELLLQVRNKLIQGYQEIMRMQI